jgi:tripartite-type tricarboxylate transporter receptor subunit TctC
MNRRFFLITAALAGLLPLAGTAPAADFSGKTVEWIIPFKEGGGSDKWARFYAPMLSEALPGKPTVVVKNVPGAGSTKGANDFQARAKPDGLTILGTSGSTQFPYLLGDKRVKYQYQDWNVVLASPTGGVVYVNPSLGVKSASELGALKGTKLLYGSQGATSLDLVPLLAFELLGLDVEPVFGMKGRGDGRLAFERGEVNIDYQTTSAYLSKVAPLVKEGKATPLMSWGALDERGNIVRDPTLPELPHFAEVYQKVTGKAPSGPAWKAWNAFFTAGFAGQKMVFLPNGTPADVIEAYNAAFKAVISAPDFKEKAAKRLGVYPQYTAGAAEQTMQLATTIAEDDRDWVKNWLTERFDVQLD